MIDEFLKSMRIEFLRLEAPRTPDLRFATAWNLAMRWQQRGEKERRGERERGREREKVSASRPAREERRCGLSTRSLLRLDACACHRQSLLSSRRPSCRRHGALRNVGVATVGPAVPLTIPFSLCPPSRERCSYVSGVSPWC